MIDSAGGQNICYVLKKVRWGMQFHIVFIATSYTATGSYLLSDLIMILKKYKAQTNSSSLSNNT